MHCVTLVRVTPASRAVFAEDIAVGFPSSPSGPVAV